MKANAAAITADSFDHLTEKQLVETIYSVLRRRGLPWVLACPESLLHGESRLDLLSLHDPEVYPGGWADYAPIANLGECGLCKAVLYSWAKQVICPLCGSKGWCT
jgi:hypothetical protein